MSDRGEQPCNPSSIGIVSVPRGDDWHGTDAGYQRHRKQGVPMCDACRQARGDYIRTLRLRKGSTKNVLVPLPLFLEVLAASKDPLTERLAALVPPALRETP